MYVQVDIESDGIATATLTIADDDYTFDILKEGDRAIIEYQETNSWRGEIRVSQPEEDVYKHLMISEQISDLLEEWDVSGVKRGDVTP